ncbi:MAG: hypothetical protein ACXWNL_16120 [Vulcanimicrobiaceae bacterium]
MKSILDLLNTIMSIPHVDTNVKTRAGYLSGWLSGGRGLGFANTFGGAF